jgi:hypothetical protein
LYSSTGMEMFFDLSTKISFKIDFKYYFSATNDEATRAIC